MFGFVTVILFLYHISVKFTLYVPQRGTSIEHSFETFIFNSSCPKHGLITVVTGGRLANKIWEYASVYAAARILNMDAFVPEEIHKELRKYFKHLSIPSETNLSQCKEFLNNKTRTTLNQTSFSYIIKYPERAKNRIITLKQWIILLETTRFLSELKTELQFREEYVANSNAIFNDVKLVKRSSDLTFVGVHVRRTDYPAYVRRKYNIDSANESFYLHAMEWFRVRYENVAFLVVSDDIQWCKKNLVSLHEDIFFVGNGNTGSPGYDLALLSLCNHSIIDYGTYGLWGAIMSGGETVYYNTSVRTFITDFASLLHSWHALG